MLKLLYRMPHHHRPHLEPPRALCDLTPELAIHYRSFSAGRRVTVDLAPSLPEPSMNLDLNLKKNTEGREGTAAPGLADYHAQLCANPYGSFSTRHCVPVDLSPSLPKPSTTSLQSRLSSQATTPGKGEAPSPLVAMPGSSPPILSFPSTPPAPFPSCHGLLHHPRTPMTWPSISPPCPLHRAPSGPSPSSMLRARHGCRGKILVGSL